MIWNYFFIFQLMSFTSSNLTLKMIFQFRKEGKVTWSCVLYVWRLLCCILLLDPDKQWGKYIYKIIILYFYSLTVMLVWRVDGENSHRQRNCRELEQPAETELQPKFLTLYSLKTPTQPTWPCLFTHSMLIFHWPWNTPMLCLFSIGHS